jgi:hypothetical protein
VHTSVVQASASSHSAAVEQAWMGVFEQVPAVQRSIVPGTPSLQSALVAQHPGCGAYALAHPVAGAQESTVQAFPSLQLTAEPPQVPKLHTSPDVQRFESLHAFALAAWEQEFDEQESSVQTFASSQSAAVRQQPATAVCSH